MIIQNEVKLDFKDVLFKPKRSNLSSRAEVDLQRSFKFKHCNFEWQGIPIIAANMDTVGTIEAANYLANQNIMTALHKHYDKDTLVNLYSRLNKNKIQYYAYSLGTSLEEFNKLNEIQEKTDQAIKIICLDVANGYTESFIKSVEKIREKYPNIILIAGNVVTSEITEQLILAGADIVKVGIGGGSACTTRIKSGVGYPQLSAVIECADAAHGLGGRVISDGGCVSPGDVAKAFGAGADFVMLGGMLAGHDENIKEDENGNPIFYGMSSETAMNMYNGGVAKYRTSEGRTVSMQRKGPLENTINDILGGVRSACTYTGAKHLRELSKCTTFIRVSQQYNNVFENNTIKR